MTPDANDLCVFAVKRGNISNRFDVRNMRYSASSVAIKQEKVTLGSLTVEEPCYGTSATAVPRTNENQPKYIRITDFDDFGIPSGHMFLAAESYSEKHLLKEGDILFARTGGTVGKTYYYDGSIGPAVFAGYCIRFRFDEKKVLPRFVYWSTKTNAYSSWVNGIQRPSGQPNINKEEYKSYELILPKTSEQQKLVCKLDSDFLIRQKHLAESEALLFGMRDFILSSLGIQKPKHAQTLVGAVKLHSIIKDCTFSAEYYHPERMAAIQMIESTGLAVMILSDIVSFHREIVNSRGSEEKYLGLAGVQSQTGELSGIVEEAAGQAFKYKAGDILYGRLRPYLNKVLLAETSGICSTEFHVMRLKENAGVLPGYLAAVLRSDLILWQTKHMMTGNTHPRISNDDVKNLYIPIPSLPVQRQIEEELQKRRMEARALKLQAEKEWAEAKAQFEKELLGE